VSATGQKPTSYLLEPFGEGLLRYWRCRRLRAPPPFIRPRMINYVDLRQGTNIETRFL
jgi:hypothetical protein